MTLTHNTDVFMDLSIGCDIFNKLNKTITKIGEKKLLNRLKYISSDYNDLEKIALTNYTINQDIFFKTQMNTYLHEIRSIENRLDNWMLNDCNNNLIFNWNLLNNRYLLSISNKLKTSFVLIIIAIYVFLYLYMYYQGIKLSPQEYLTSIIKNQYAISKLMLYSIFSNKQIIEYSAIGLVTLYVLWQLYVMYQNANSSYEHYVNCYTFYDEYEKIVEYINVVEKMVKIDTYNANQEITKSIDYLKYYFTDDVSLGFSLVAKISNQDYITHIDKLLNYVGRIDCQLCITKLLEDDKYTIPKFIKSQFPILHIEDMWNPLIDINKRVVNSLMMNVNTPNTVILTGPNKAGKSTYMRTIIICVYLSQSIGISCSNRISLTPFRDLFTYLNVPDKIGKESLFEAELNRCYEYIEKIESFRGFSLGIIDELFTGTNPFEGESASYAVTKRLSINPTNITILSTHFNEFLCRLDKNNFIFNKFIANRENDKFTYTYKLENGISSQCIALQLLKDRGFSKDIVDDALQFLTFITLKNAR